MLGEGRNHSFRVKMSARASLQNMSLLADFEKGKPDMHAVSRSCAFHVKYTVYIIK